MSSFKEVRELLLVAYDSEIINGEEFLVLFENYRSRNPQYPYNSYPRFELENMQHDECLAEFRVKKEDVPRLADVLQIPETVRCEQRSVCGRIEGLCKTMLLRRLPYPCRYSDMIHRFARPVPEICMITNTVMDFIFDHHAHRLTQYFECPSSSKLCRGSVCTRCTTSKLFWFCRQNCPTDCKTWGAPKTGVQLSQKGAFAKISVAGITEWSYCKYVRIHR